MPFKLLSFYVACERHFLFQSIFGYAVLYSFFKCDTNAAEDMENFELVSVGFEPCLYASEELVISVTLLE